ncbi:Undecaprenyl phosphate-alpha-4-amino-4-deoxy-L-arabinose arabinosyl transferase [Massilia sp. Bi118]|uniref:glycosyltransferase family 39 protein n=1 Tax=Massilia sp. Bi118 TaxID=2822346 RepID=UPI001D8BA991|nr:glycosyltransferase family 39 protein [Massilia sp. Bi118]CAH0233180.1 Undecaprenyl phosphate-alpha-4-amino-4-deoxy-L-arabinose arabinosyl transferase [Massilia sp. Bi118]
MRELHKNKTLVWTLFLAFAAVLLGVLKMRTLVPPDEGRYAEMAREMFASGDWITTRLNGIKYFEKPPLQTWMNALTFEIFGLGEWQARLWTGLCGLLGVGLTGYTGMRVFGSRVGFYAGLVLASSLYWVICSQVNSVDMSLSSMMTIALCALLIAQRDEATPSEQRNWMLLCWAGMALSVLAKGLIGLVLPGGILVFYTLFSRDWTIWTRLHLVKGLLLFFLIAAPWFVLVGLKNPEQPHFFFIHEHFDRFLKKEHHREAAWYVFFVLLAAGSVPWVGVLVQSLWLGAKRTLEPGRFKPRLMLLVWTAFIILFFTKSNSKLPGYIVPVFPAVALLVANYLEDGSRRGRMLTAGLTALLGAGLLGFVPFMLKLARHPGEDVLYAAYQPWVLAAGLVLLIGGALAMLYTRQMQRDLTVLVLAIAGFAGVQLLLVGFEPIGQVRAGAGLLPAMKAAGAANPATRVYSVGIYEQSLTFYLGRPVTLVDYTDEFAFGLEQQPELGIPTIPAFLERWRADAAAGVTSIAIVRPEFVAEFQRQGVPLRVVAGDARRTVIATR